MREILFKGKRKDNGEWVEGQLFKTNLLTFIFPGATNGSFDGKAMKFINPCYYVDPETVCQYTGLTDRNGNKIWENSIVNNVDCEEENGEPCYAKVVFHKETWYLKESRFEPQCTLHETTDVLEIVGNIFDNPELMEGIK